MKSWTKKLQKYKIFHGKKDVLSANSYQVVHMTVVPVVQDLPTLSALLYDVHNADGNIIGETAGQSVQKYEITMRQLKNNN